MSEVDRIWAKLCDPGTTRFEADQLVSELDEALAKEGKTRDQYLLERADLVLSLLTPVPFEWIKKLKRRFFNHAELP